MTFAVCVGGRSVVNELGRNREKNRYPLLRISFIF